MRVVLDTNVMGAAVLPGGSQSDRQRALGLLRIIGEGGHEALLPAVVVAELGVGYRKAGLAAEWGEFMQSLPAGQPYEFVPMDAAVADCASRVRHETSLRLPDAVVVATGIVASAGLVVSQDPDLSRGSKYLRVANLLKATRMLRGGGG